MRAELGERDRGLDEAAVVAAHDGDAVALVDALVGERVREGVGAAVDLLEGERAELVDDGSRIRVPQRLHGVAERRRRAPGEIEAPEADEVVGAHGADEPRAYERPDIEDACLDPAQN